MRLIDTAAYDVGKVVDMKRDRKLERMLSIVSLSISQFMMYGIGKNAGSPTDLLWITVLLSVTAIVCAGILE